MTAGGRGSGRAPKRQKNAPGAGASAGVGAAAGGRGFGWLQPPVKLSSAADWRAAAATTAAIARSGGATTKRQRPGAGGGRGGGDGDGGDDDAPGSDDEVDYERRRRALVLRARRDGEYRGGDDDGSWMEDEDEDVDVDVEEWERGGIHRGYSRGKQSEEWDYYDDDGGDEEARGDYDHDQHEHARRYDGARVAVPGGRVGVDRPVSLASLASSLSSFRREVRGQMAAVTASVERLAGTGGLTHCSSSNSALRRHATHVLLTIFICLKNEGLPFDLRLIKKRAFCTDR